MSAPVCPECGARLQLGASQCDLCGSEVTTAPAAPGPAALPDAGAACPGCGTVPPAQARFCPACGTRLPERAASSASPVPAAPSASPALPARTPQPAARRAVALVAAAALLVVVLFAASHFGGRVAPLVPPDAAQADEGSSADAVALPSPEVLPPEVAARARELEERIAAADDPNQRLALQIELVEALATAGAFAQAGAVQEAIARSVNTASAWADAGSFYLAHMLRSQGQVRADYAQRSARAYEASLARNPEDLDVKTDLATAYLNDPADPMRAVTVIREVLDADPNHARARFNYALMLTQIGRLDQAREQFARVLTASSPGDLVHDRALEELDRIDQILGTQDPS